MKYYEFDLDADHPLDDQLSAFMTQMQSGIEGICLHSPDILYSHIDSYGAPTAGFLRHYPAILAIRAAGFMDGGDKILGGTTYDAAVAYLRGFGYCENTADAWVGAVDFGNEYLLNTI